MVGLFTASSLNDTINLPALRVPVNLASNKFSIVCLSSGAGTPLLKFTIPTGKKPFSILLRCRLDSSASLNENCNAEIQSGNE